MQRKRQKKKETKYKTWYNNRDVIALIRSHRVYYMVTVVVFDLKHLVEGYPQSHREWSWNLQSPLLKHDLLQLLPVGGDTNLPHPPPPSRLIHLSSPLPRVMDASGCCVDCVATRGPYANEDACPPMILFKKKWKTSKNLLYNRKNVLLCVCGCVCVGGVCVYVCECVCVCVCELIIVRVCAIYYI